MWTRIEIDTHKFLKYIDKIHEIEEQIKMLTRIRKDLIEDIWFNSLNQYHYYRDRHYWHEAFTASQLKYINSLPPFNAHK